MIIITGAAGFIGSNLLISLEEKGHRDIVICDYFYEDERWRNLRKHGFNQHVFPEHLPDFLEQYKDQVDIIFHMGASSSTTEQNVDKLIEYNVNYSMFLWDWCAANKKRLIYASSAATYGDGNQGFDDKQSSKFLRTLKPLNAYGWSKQVFDLRIANDIEAGKPTPPQWAGLKFFNVYGPNEYHKGSQQSVLSNLFPYAREKAALRLFKSYRPQYKNGEQLRDFVYVLDCCNVMIWLMENPEHSGIFNVGTGKARSFNDLAQALFSSLNTENPKIDYIDMPTEIRGNYQYFTEANMDKLRDIGYDAPMTSLEEGTKHYVQQYLSQSDPYR